VQICRL